MKQNLNKYFKVIAIVGLIFSLPSCLKNNKYYADFSQGKPAVELPLAATNANQPFAVSFDVADTPTTYYAVVNVASVDIPTQPVTATLGLDAAYLTQYNADQTAADPNYTPFELLPDSAYSIPSFDATIPAGQREFYVPVKFFTNKIESGHAYVLPLTIVSSSVNISNWNHLLINVGAKNQWDGVYKSAGEFTHPAYGDLIWDYSKGITQELVTAGPKSVSMYPTNTTIGGFGVELDITINPDNTLVEVFNGVTTPTPNTDHYDPATRTFYVSGAYVGGSGPRTYKATLMYVKPR